MQLNAQQRSVVDELKSIGDAKERERIAREVAPEAFPAPAGNAGRVAVWVAAFSVLGLIALVAMVGYIWLELEDKGGEEIIAIVTAVVGGIIGCFMPQPKAVKQG